MNGKRGRKAAGKQYLFGKDNVNRWLPQDAELYFRWRGRQVQRRHGFDKDLLFAVEAAHRSAKGSGTLRRRESKGRAQTPMAAIVVFANGRSESRLRNGPKPPDPTRNTGMWARAKMGEGKKENLHG